MAACPRTGSLKCRERGALVRVSVVPDAAKAVGCRRTFDAMSPESPATFLWVRFLPEADVQIFTA